MNAIELLNRQLQGSNALIHELADDLSPEEWAELRVLPNTNFLGFTVWHLARSMDWAVQTAIRGIPEVILRPEWSSRPGLAGPEMGAGLDAEDADRVARTTHAFDVLAYADAVSGEILDWLGHLSPADLDRVPDLEANEANLPQYQSEGHRAEVAHLMGEPAWRLLSGPCIGHIRSHVGECGLLKQALRRAGSNALASEVCYVESGSVSARA
ncbi:MAG TPA: hypothetical protein VNG93_15325 [Candidatus Dormibacteraeota bacterium]|nr:hypothetical protein [Candidatus Dormibacteraeota bacterium]